MLIVWYVNQISKEAYCNAVLKDNCACIGKFFYTFACIFVQFSTSSEGAFPCSSYKFLEAIIALFVFRGQNL